jgi:ubiquinone/menaquinone biosynthesis C-methylase UbiE
MTWGAPDRRALLVALVACALTWPGTGSAQQEPAPASPLPPLRQEYLGRAIAQTMHYTGAEWLIRDVREREERCSLMLAHLGARPGMVICDMGCGNGFYSLQLARQVGATGRVLAVDAQPEMLVMLRERAEQAGIENITPILGSWHDPRLPADSVDLILLVDVYHEFSHPEQMLASMRQALKPEGLIVLVEYRAEDPNVPILPLHKMSQAQILKEMAANGLRLARQFDKLPWQHMMFFGRDEQWQP